MTYIWHREIVRFDDQPAFALASTPAIANASAKSRFLVMLLLRDVAAYLCHYGSIEQNLEIRRLTMLVYLADWKHVLAYGTPLTTIVWRFDKTGPYVTDILDTAISYPQTLSITNRRHGLRFSQNIGLACHPVWLRYEAIEPESFSILAGVVNQTKNQSDAEFLATIHATYPVSTRTRSGDLNLVAAAKDMQSAPNRWTLDLVDMAHELQNTTADWNRRKMQRARRHAFNAALAYSAMAETSPIAPLENQVRQPVYEKHF